jgi:hypothetical protein
LFQILTTFGTSEQKQKYLPAMATGERIGAWCFSEAGSGFDARCFETKAVAEGVQGSETHTSGAYYITGEKRPVVNGVDADFFIVFAKTEVN